MDAPVAKSGVHCEVCGTPSRLWASINDYAHFKCPKCEHVFVFPRPSQQVLDDFYGKGKYYAKAELKEAGLRREARRRARRLWALAKKYCLEPRVLDVGCASGIFLVEAAAVGLGVQGIERSRVMADRARDLTGHRIDVGIFEDMTIPGSPFPIVTAWEVVEHALDVQAFFATLSRNVEVGGIVSISTPMSDGIIARLLGVRFPMLSPPEHLSLFSQRSLALMAAAHGFRCVKFRSFSNMDGNSIASGLARYVMGKEFASLGLAARSAAWCLGHLLFWAPWIIDVLGQGSEMEVVLLKIRD